MSYTAEAGLSSAIALGDLNGDGIIDIVSAGKDDPNDGYATVRLGRGDGTFGSATSYTAETNSTQDVQLADLNSDGVLDLATAGNDGADGYFTVRLGRGDGTFGSATSYAGENRTTNRLAFADLNGDGTLDVATAGDDAVLGGQSTVRLGRGDGTFGAATTYQMDVDEAEDVALADLNGDGKADLISVGDGPGGGSVYIRLGNGDGSFSAASSYTTVGDANRMVETGDLNGDGILDVVISGRDVGTVGYATVMLGAGNGTFSSITTYQQETDQSLSVALGDLNSDGVVDLVTAGDEGVNSGIRIRLANTVDGVAPIVPFSLRTLADARQALPVFQQKRDQLATQRGQIGAFQSRISVASNVLQVTSENFRAAESRIRDADMAQESSDLVRLNILQQAASSVLAQANQQPALALRLLQT